MHRAPRPTIAALVMRPWQRVAGGSLLATRWWWRASGNAQLVARRWWCWLRAAGDALLATRAFLGLRTLGIVLVCPA